MVDSTSVPKMRGLLTFSHFSLVRTLYFRMEEAELGYVLDLVIENEQERPPLVCHLRFFGVSELRLEGFGGTGTRIMGFDVNDISDRGWEGISVEVYDFENNDIHFFARRMEIVALDRDPGCRQS